MKRLASLAIVAALVVACGATPSRPTSTPNQTPTPSVTSTAATGTSTPTATRTALSAASARGFSFQCAGGVTFEVEFPTANDSEDAIVHLGNQTRTLTNQRIEAGTRYSDGSFSIGTNVKGTAYLERDGNLVTCTATPIQ